MKTVFITGASGFVGQYLAREFLESGYNVYGTGTSGSHPLSEGYDRFVWITADTTQKGTWQRHVSESDVVINLAGRNIFAFWTRKYKQQIYDSRILTTRHIVEALPEKGILLNASAVGIYGDNKDHLLTESSPPGNDFLASVCIDWEKEACQAIEKQVRVICMRFGVIMGKGGALSKMLTPFKWGVGGPLGSGNQWFPWIHIRDLYRAVLFLLENRELSGPFNFTSPGRVRQKEFAGTLGKILFRPAFIPVPGFAISLFMGEMGKSLLNSQKAIPDKLTEQGFSFEFSDLSQALKDIL